MGSSTQSRSRSPAGSGSTTESTAPRRSASDDVVPRPSTRRHAPRRRSRSRDVAVSRRRSSTEEHYYRDGGSSSSHRYGSRDNRGSSPSRGYSSYFDDRHRRQGNEDHRRREENVDRRRRDDGDYRRRNYDDHKPRRRDDRSDRLPSGGSYYDVRSSRDPSNGTASLHYVNSSPRVGSKQDESRSREVSDQLHRRRREDSRPRPRGATSGPGPVDESIDGLPRDAKTQSIVPPLKVKPMVEFGKAVRPDPRATAEKGNVLELNCDCPRKYVSDGRPLREPAWLSRVRWDEPTFEEHILLKREFAPRAVANARGQAMVPPPTVSHGSTLDGSWHETWPNDVDCRIICVLRLPDLVSSDETFLRAAREAIPHHSRARVALQKAVVIRASGIGGSVVPAKCGYLVFRSRRDAHECWSLQHLKLYGYVCPLIADPTAFRILCQIALVLKLYEGNSVGATSSLTARLVPEASPSMPPLPPPQATITSTKFGGGLSSRKPLPSTARGADTSSGVAAGGTSRGRFVLRGLKESLQRLKGPPVDACGNCSASAVRYSRLDQRDGAVVGRSEYVRAETSSDGQSQKLNIGLTKDRNVVVLETNDDTNLADWRPEWVLRDWSWGCRPMSVALAEKESADGEIDPAELSDYSTYSAPDMSVFKPVRSVPLTGGTSPQSKARSGATSRKSKKSKKEKKKKRRTSHELAARLAGEGKAEGATTKASTSTARVQAGS